MLTALNLNLSDSLSLAMALSQSVHQPIQDSALAVLRSKLSTLLQMNRQEFKRINSDSNGNGDAKSNSSNSTALTSDDLRFIPTEATGKSPSLTVSAAHPARTIAHRCCSLFVGVLL